MTAALLAASAFCQVRAWRNGRGFGPAELTVTGRRTVPASLGPKSALSPAHRWAVPGMDTDDLAAGTPPAGEAEDGGEYLGAIN